MKKAQKSDLFNIYLKKRDTLKNADNQSLAIAILLIQWESYTEALVDFGIINKKERDELLNLPGSFP